MDKGNLLYGSRRLSLFYVGRLGARANRRLHRGIRARGKRVAACQLFNTLMEMMFLSNKGIESHRRQEAQERLCMDIYDLDKALKAKVSRKAK